VTIGRRTIHNILNDGVQAGHISAAGKNTDFFTCHDAPGELSL
jgi:hypothetical protein